MGKHSKTPVMHPVHGCVQIQCHHYTNNFYKFAKIFAALNYPRNLHYFPNSPKRAKKLHVSTHSVKVVAEFDTKSLTNVLPEPLESQEVRQRGQLQQVDRIRNLVRPRVNVVQGELHRRVGKSTQIICTFNQLICTNSHILSLTHPD